MTLILRQQKGNPLTIEEMDNNFKFLHERIKILENFLYERDHLTVMQDNEQVIFKTGKGEEIGKITLPNYQFSMKGEWSENEIYLKNDFVRYSNSIYVCNTNHQAKNFENEMDKWTLFV